jgi:hypothetical protein
MKFLLPNYSCLQNPWLGGCHPQIPVLSVPCPQLNLLNPPEKKIPGYATAPWQRTICQCCPYEPTVEWREVYVDTLSKTRLLRSNENGWLQILLFFLPDSFFFCRIPPKYNFHIYLFKTSKSITGSFLYA